VSLSKYVAFAKTGQPLTWEAIAKIETEALVEAKVSPEMARATVAKALKALKDAGVAARPRRGHSKL
jgi:carbamoylphosphate synthase large subunit